MSKEKIFAMYKGDEFICTGTVKEIAAMRNITVQSVYFYASNTYKNRIRKSNNSIEVYRIEDEVEAI